MDGGSDPRAARTPGPWLWLRPSCSRSSRVAALPYRTAVESKIQHDIEDKVHVKAGDYLGQVVRPGQTVTTESSGYLGYDTNGTWYDFPGLESPTVVDTIRKAGAENATAPTA